MEKLENGPKTVLIGEAFEEIYRLLGYGFLILGLIAGISVAIISLLIQANYTLCFVVGLSLLVSITISGAMGVLTPFILKKMNIDPAVAAGPFITNFNDVTGIFIYLGLVTLFLHYI